MPTSATDVLSLATAKEQLRITGADADVIVTTAIGAAVSFVADATGASLEAIAASGTLRMAVVYATREFFNGHREIPPRHAIFTLLNAAPPCR